MRAISHMITTLLTALAAYVILPSSPSTTPLEQFTAALPVAQATQRPQPPVKRRLESVGIKTNAPSVFVADGASGAVLFAKNPHRVLPIASLTKLVTAMVLLDLQPDLAGTITITKDDFDRESAAVFQPEEIIRLEDALASLLVGSVNTSANAIARASGGKDAFVSAMNAKVRKLGLHSPVFVDPTGVDPRNRANAADVAAMISFASGYPKIRKALSLADVTIRGLNNSRRTYVVKSTNLLLYSYLHQKPYQIIAAKTGSLPEAGYCMAQVTRNGAGRQVIVVELGNENHFARFQDIKALTSWAFDTYEWK